MTAVWGLAMISLSAQSLHGRTLALRFLLRAACCALIDDAVPFLGSSSDPPGRFRLKDDDNKKHCDMLRFCREPKPLSAVIGTNMPGMSGKGNSGLSTAFIQMEEHRKTGELRRQAAVEKRKMELARELGREYNPEDEVRPAALCTSNPLSRPFASVRADPASSRHSAVPPDSGLHPPHFPSLSPLLSLANERRIYRTIWRSCTARS